ncbi:hypothetical protein C8J57DRAFT_1065984 [Mycena rebaudengoi]|nr:hypothetical protein C8J57DRAFT_1065984 [Mycena rebaudengoi]
MASSSRSASPGASTSANGSTVSSQMNYLPNKFSSAVRRHAGSKVGKGGPQKLGGGTDAFRANEMWIPRHDDQSYDGVDFGKSGKSKWNGFKWVLVFANTILSLFCHFYTIVSLGGLIFVLGIWLNIFQHADIFRIGNRPEIILSTVAVSMGAFTASVGWAGIVLNNRSFLAVYALLLWVAFIFLVIPGYLTYKKAVFNLEGKISKQWSSELGSIGRQRIQTQLQCCGFFSPFVEATVSPTCYARSTLPGCKNSYWAYEKIVLKRWYISVFTLGLPVTIGSIVVGLLCSNHVTYRFGKGMMSKAYRLSSHGMAVIMDNYAAELSEQYGPKVAQDMLARSRSNLYLDALPAIEPTSRK